MSMSRERQDSNLSEAADPICTSSASCGEDVRRSAAVQPTCPSESSHRAADTYESISERWESRPWALPSLVRFLDPRKTMHGADRCWNESSRLVLVAMWIVEGPDGAVAACEVVSTQQVYSSWALVGGSWRRARSQSSHQPSGKNGEPVRGPMGTLQAHLRMDGFGSVGG